MQNEINLYCPKCGHPVNLKPVKWVLKKNGMYVFKYRSECFPCQVSFTIFAGAHCDEISALTDAPHLCSGSCDYLYYHKKTLRDRCMRYKVYLDTEKREYPAFHGYFIAQPKRCSKCLIENKEIVCLPLYSKKRVKKTSSQ